MSSPVIWMAFPLALALILFGLQRYTRWVTLSGVLLTAGMALLAILLPVEQPMQWLNLSFKISDTLNILGRKFTLSSGDLPFVAFIYFIASIWFLGSLAAKTTPSFIPLGLGMVIFLIAALTVDPFLYAALLIEIAVLLSIPIMSPPGIKAGYGIQRYLIFQTLAVPFILFTGWMLTGVENNPADAVLATRVIIMLGLGFAFLLAIFPFYTWIPTLVEEAPPYVTGFVFVMLPMIAVMFLLNFLDRYTWLRSDLRIYDTLRLTGVLMVTTAGIFAAFQQNLGRILGYAVIIETGLALLSISSASVIGLGLFSAQLLTRACGLWLWALALDGLKQRLPALGFKDIHGVFRKFPFISASILLALFSLAGLPLLAGFPIRLSLLDLIAQSTQVEGQSSSLSTQFSFFVQSQTAVVWIALGLLGLFVAGFHSLLIMASPGEEPGWSVGEKPAMLVPLSLGMLVLFLIGLFPHWFLPGMQAILRGFIHLLS